MDFTVERTEIDGVQVLWANLPGPLTAVLLFGCGIRDEDFRSRGVTAVVEQTALGMPRTPTGPVISGVTPEITRFEVTGTPDQLRDRLAVLCAALADLPAVRPPVLDGGGLAGDRDHARVECLLLLAARYGAAGHGLVGWPVRHQDDISPDRARAHAARYFVTGNARLVLSGRPPDGLRLPLPAGLPVVRTRPSEVMVPGPGMVTVGDTDGRPGTVVLGLRGPADHPAWTLALHALDERLTRAAGGENGWCRGVSVKMALLASDTTEWMIQVDGHPAHLTELTCLLWETAGAIAHAGHTQDELTTALADADAELADPAHVMADLRNQAVDELVGGMSPRLSQLRASLTTVTPDEVAAVFDAALRTALVVVPAGIEPGLALDGVPLQEAHCCTGSRLPRGRVFRRPQWISRVPRPELVLTDDAIASRAADGTVHVLPFAEIVGIGEHRDCRWLVGRRGCAMYLDPQTYGRLGPVLRALTAAVPDQLRFPLYWP